MMSELTCPICNSRAAGGHAVGDDTVVICPNCGGYRLSGTAQALLRNGTLPTVDPQRFRDLVARKRGSSAEYPVITSGDIGG